MIPFSILVTKVTPGLYINMTKEPLCLSSLPLWAPGLFLPKALMCWGEEQTQRPCKRRAVPPNSTHACPSALPNISLPIFPYHLLGSPTPPSLKHVEGRHAREFFHWSPGSEAHTALVTPPPPKCFLTSLPPSLTAQTGSHKQRHKRIPWRMLQTRNLSRAWLPMIP